MDPQNSLSRRRFVTTAGLSLPFIVASIAANSTPSKIVAAVLKQPSPTIAILLYPGFTALDVIGPYEMLTTLPNTQVHLVAETLDAVRANTSRLTIQPTATLDDITAPDIVLVPGGSVAGTTAARTNRRLLRWLQAVHPRTTWMLTASTGAIILAAANVGLPPTVTDWDSRPALERFWVTYVPERYIQQDSVIVGTGLSASIDLALFTASQLTDEPTALAIQFTLASSLAGASSTNPYTQTAGQALSLLRERTHSCISLDNTRDIDIFCP